jgi:hypothetical protein
MKRKTRSREWLPYCLGHYALVRRLPLYTGEVRDVRELGWRPEEPEP